MALDVFGWNPYLRVEGAWIVGSLERRAGLGILLALASVWSTGWRAWVLAGLSVATGSLVGIPAVVRVLLSRGAVGLMALAAVVVVAIPSVLERVQPRLELWGSLDWMRSWTGWGFRLFPGGFQEVGAVNGAEVFIPYRDYHNVFVDWILRAGIIGAASVVAWIIWVFRQGLKGWRGWTIALALWVGVVQSAEAIPVILVLFACWMVGLTREASL